jgi:hypothetical protein
MLKPFPQRVQSTLDFLHFLINWSGQNKTEIEKTRSTAIRSNLEKTYHHFNYRLTNASVPITFKGYEAVYKKSEVTGLDRLFYDRTKPYSKTVSFYNSYKSSDSLRIPEAYIISGEATAVIQLLEENGVVLKKMDSCTREVLTMRVKNVKSPSKPYEGHFLHNSTEIEEQKETVKIPGGSVYISCDQPKLKFILSVLEPETEDSYFNWNFFDSYIQEKEYFSAYVFEDKALEILKTDAELKKNFEAKKASDPAFASDSWAQLFYIYQHSSYFESKTFNRLPVFKVYNW